jgi:O-antigen/teichoic acid export membrane protein
MYRLKQHITHHPHYEKAKYWTKLVSITGAAQTVVQAVGFVSGILVIRLLPVDEYALYTLANTMLGTMTILSDGGISTGVMAQGGKVWQDRQKLGAVLATGLDLRRKFAIVSLIVSIPILCYLLLHHGANWVTTLLISASLIPAFYASLSDNLLQIPVKLHQAIPALQRNQLEVGVGRLLLTGLTLFAFPWAFVAIIASGIPRIWGNVKLRKIADGFVDKEQTLDSEVKDEILKVVKRVLPGSVYLVISGQISIWILSVFGTNTAIAELGAINRISVLLSLFSAIFGTLAIPRFARLPNKRSILIKNFIRIMTCAIVLCMTIIVATYVVSSPILWILGSDYSKLDFELLLAIIVSCLNFVASIVFSLYSGRAWIMNPFIVMVINVLSVIAGVYFFDVSTIRGVLYMNLVVNFINLVRTLFYMTFKLKFI